MTSMRRREIGRLLSIACASIFIRVLLFTALLLSLHYSPERVARMRDGYHYLDYAHGIVVGKFASIDPFHRRLFPGYPVLIAAFTMTGLRPEIAALILNWFAAAATAPLAAILFGDD